MLRTLIVLGVGITIGATMQSQRHKVGASIAHRIVDAVFGEDPRSYRDRPYDQARH